MVFNNLPQVSPKVRDRIRKTVLKTGYRVEQRIKESMEEPKHGRVYRSETEVGFTTKSGKQVSFTAHKGGATEHQASAPGEAPAVDLGHLIGSVKTEMTGPLTAVVSEDGIGAYLEFGAEKAHIAPRPHMGPALETVREIFIEEVTRDLEEATQ